MIDTAKLRQLIAGADAPLPWFYQQFNQETASQCDSHAYLYDARGNGLRRARLDKDSEVTPEIAALIVHLANNAEAIADELDQRRREIAELKGENREVPVV